jgi:transposase
MTECFLPRYAMTPEALEKRRMKALPLFRRGVAQAAIAKQLGVSRPAVHYWYRAWKKEGVAGLKQRPVGPRSHMTEAGVRKVERALLKGPAAYGYATDFWTLERIKHVMYSIAGVSYGTTHVWRILRSMGWSTQRPERRARERDEKAIERWKKVEWPSIKKRGSHAAQPLYLRTNRGIRAAVRDAHLGSEGMHPGHRVGCFMESAHRHRHGGASRKPQASPTVSQDRARLREGC